MLNVEHSVIVDMPIEDVWAYMDDLSHYPTWVAGLAELRQTTPGPKGVGTRMAWVYHLLGRRIEVETEVTEFVPNRRFAARNVSGPMRFHGIWDYEPTGAGTRIGVRLDGETGGFFHLADPLVSRALRRQLQASYGTLKDLLENDRSAGVEPVVS